MARRHIKIAKADGTNVVNLYDFTLKLPDPYPEIQYKTQDKTFQMRPGPTGPGNLVHKSLGSNINHAEVTIMMHSITAAEAVLLLAMYSARPNVVLLSMDSGTTRYYAKFKENGLVPEGYQNNEDPVTGKAYFTKANIELYLLQTTTQDYA